MPYAERCIDFKRCTCSLKQEKKNEDHSPCAKSEMLAIMTILIDRHI